MTWLVFVLLTVVSWGVYGVFLHTGSTGMADPVNGRYKAFLFVGIAYFLVAILGPLLMLILSGANWQYPAKGMWWSLIAGVVGAIGAFGVLLALGKGGHPSVVMALVFSGAPVVNAIVGFIQHPPKGGFGAISPGFWLGIALAAAGGYCVNKFKPAPAPPKKPIAAIEQKVEGPVR